MGKILGQFYESGRKERAIYYLSKKFTDYETRYTALEKTCCALAWAAHRLRHYILNLTTMLIARMDPLKYIFEKPSFAKQKKKGAGGDSLKAKKLRMTLSRRRRAKANTGGRPRLSYFNTLCAHQY